ncbi:TIGR02679 domain-containing protein [Nocardia abscessus]|uniref:TIGR02679 domain-containing protein n=1 Tax=Nocardia abscessus TaxID=120957 RepID=UPI003CC7EC50
MNLGRSTNYRRPRHISNPHPTNQSHTGGATSRHALAVVPRLARRICASGVSETDIEAIALQSRQLKSALDKIETLRRSGAAPLTLAKLAHDCAGDPHAFDLDTLTGDRLVEAVAELLAEPDLTRPDTVRALLARASILADRLSSAVLVPNLHASGNGVVDRRLRLGGGQCH